MESQRSPTPRIRPMTKQRAGAHEIAREGAWYQTREVCHTALRSARIWSLFSTHQTARARHAVLSLDTAESSNHMRGCFPFPPWPRSMVGASVLGRGDPSEVTPQPFSGGGGSNQQLGFDSTNCIQSTAARQLNLGTTGTMSDAMGPDLHTNVTNPLSQRQLMSPDWPESTPSRDHVLRSITGCSVEAPYPTDDLTVTCSG